MTRRINRTIYITVVSIAIVMASAAMFTAVQSFAHTGSLHSNQAVMKGKALDVGISINGTTYIVSPSGEAWRWGSSFGEEWSYIGGEGLLRIDVGPDNRPWAVDRSGRILFYNSAYWEKRGDGAIDIGVGPNGVVLALLRAGRIVGWDPETKRFRQYLASTGRRIDVDLRGLPWIVDDDGQLAHYNGQEWRVFDTVARDVSVGPDGEVFIADDEGTASRHLTSAISQDVPGFSNVVSLSAGPKGHLWAVREDQSILTMSLFEEERGIRSASVDGTATRPSMAEILNIQRRRRSSVDVARITSSAPFEFVLVSGIAATDIGIGADGSVFAVDNEGRFKRFNQRAGVFFDFPGQIRAIAVDREGNPWGVTPSGDVFRHNGRDWRQLTGAFETARDIAVNSRDAAFITDVNDRVFRFDVETNRFVLYPGLNGARIAVDPAGRPWTVDSDGAVFRCDGEVGCSRTPAPKSADIGIGPDGSIFLASARNDLSRYNPSEQKFVFLSRIGTGITVVEVGPRGRPWVIDVNNRVFASGFFKRDERNDVQTALTTRTETSDVPSIVFTKRLRLPGFTDVRRRISDAGTVRASRSGDVVVTADSGVIWRFDKTSKRFKTAKITAPLVTQSFGPAVPITALFPDGRLVFLDSVVGATSTTHRIFLQRKIGRPAAELMTEITLDNDNKGGRIHVGPEQVLYFSIIEETPVRSRLFRMNPGRKILTEINVAAAGVDPIENFLEQSGGGQENVLHNVFINIETERESIRTLTGKRFEKIFETDNEITGITSNDDYLYACIDEILSRFNESTKKFTSTTTRCLNIAATPENLIFYIKP